MRSQRLGREPAALVSSEQAPPAPHAGARFFLEVLRRRGFEGHGTHLLTVGDHGAVEAAYLANALGAATAVAIDTRTGLAAPEGVALLEASVCAIPYPDCSFDLVFYHHVIEHVAEPWRSLDEIARVLRPRGLVFVGTPNRSRIISSVDAPAHEEEHHKVRENMHQWGARLRGRFHNEAGEHAGFTRLELARMLDANFDTLWLTKAYLRFKYQQGARGVVARVLTMPGLLEVSPPSLYGLGTRHPLHRDCISSRAA